MPKQSRKARTKYKVQQSPKVFAVNEVSQTQSLPASSRPATIVKSSIPRGRQGDYQRQAITELKRIGLIAVILLALLVTVSLLIR